MKTVKQIAKYVLIALIGAATVAGTVVYAWESIRPHFVSDNTVLIERKDERVITEYDRWLETPEVKEELELMWLKHQRKELDEKIAEKQGLL